MDKKRSIFIKTIDPPYARLEADRIHNHIEGLITFELDGLMVAQANRENIEYWCVDEIEESKND